VARAGASSRLRLSTAQSFVHRPSTLRFVTMRRDRRRNCPSPRRQHPTDDSRSPTNPHRCQTRLSMREPGDPGTPQSGKCILSTFSCVPQRSVVSGGNGTSRTASIRQKHENTPRLSRAPQQPTAGWCRSSHTAPPERKLIPVNLRGRFKPRGTRVPCPLLRFSSLFTRVRHLTVRRSRC